MYVHVSCWSWTASVAQLVEHLQNIAGSSLTWGRSFFFVFCELHLYCVVLLVRVPWLEYFMYMYMYMMYISVVYILKVGWAVTAVHHDTYIHVHVHVHGKACLLCIQCTFVRFLTTSWVICKALCTCMCLTQDKLRAWYICTHLLLFQQLRQLIFSVLGEFNMLRLE